MLLDCICVFFGNGETVTLSETDILDAEPRLHLLALNLCDFCVTPTRLCVAALLTTQTQAV